MTSRFSRPGHWEQSRGTDLIAGGEDKSRKTVARGRWRREQVGIHSQSRKQIPAEPPRIPNSGEAAEGIRQVSFFRRLQARKGS